MVSIEHSRAGLVGGAECVDATWASSIAWISWGSKHGHGHGRGGGGAQVPLGTEVTVVIVHFTLTQRGWRLTLKAALHGFGLYSRSI
jgi:hypothetical protein